MHDHNHTTYGVALRLGAVAVLIAVATIVPFSVHAGFFDVIFGTASAKTPDSYTFASTDTAQTLPLLRAVQSADPNPAKGGGDILIQDGALVPDRDIDGKETKINTKTANGEISVYAVREGDTLSQIAEMYDVSAKTILWANSITDPSKIHPGDKLVILPITGVRHVVKSGDTIASIAKKYSGDVDDILAYNQLASASHLSVGDTLVIPDGTMATPQPKKANGTKTAAVTGNGSAGFSHPLPGATKTQGIHGYNGIDLSGVPVGTSVLAAASGDVIVAKGSGWNGGYGSYVVIRHPNGTQTLYAHLSSVYVTGGQSVEKGVAIGGMGNTGRSTGAHLHFEVRGAKNPF